MDEGNIHSEVPNGASLSTSIVLAQENCNLTCSLNEASVDLVNETSTRPDFSQSMQVDNGSPNHNTSPLYGAKLDYKLDICWNPSERVKLVQDISENTRSSHSSKIGLETKEDAFGSDWENLISDNTDDMLISEPATGSETSKSEEKDNGMSLNSLPNVSCFHNVSQASFMDDDGDASEQHGISHPLKLLSSTCQDQGDFDDLNQKIEAEHNDGVSLCCKVNLCSAWSSYEDFSQNNILNLIIGNLITLNCNYDYF